MKCIVIGAGNAGRPAARILNYVGNKVKITDRKTLEEFPDKVQKTLLKMEEEGVNLHLGSDTPLDFVNLDAAYISPTVPENAPIKSKLTKNNVKLISNSDISLILNDVIDIDIIGVTGTLGKTSTTHTISEIFKNAGYKVWMCSSRMGNLLSEVIVDGIIKGNHKKNNIAVLELPHGTSRLMSKVHLKVGVLTNLYRDHLDEFDDSMEKYVARKLFIAHSSDVLVAGAQCKEFVESVRNDVVFYCTEALESEALKSNTSKCDVSGYQKGKNIEIQYNLNKFNRKSKTNGKLDNKINESTDELTSELTGKFETQFNLSGYYFENSIAAAAAALCYGLDEKFIKKGLSNFHGIPGHMEYIGNYKGREVHFDAAFVPEGLVSTLELFSDRYLIVLIDNPDSTNPRDKYKIGSVLGRYADVIISTGYNETTKKMNMNAAHKVLEGAEDSKAIKIAVEDMKTAGTLSIKHSKPGDVILHVGPGAITNYEDIKFKMMSGIEEGCTKYE